MPIPHKHINSADEAYELETSYYLHFRLFSALISLDHILIVNTLTMTCFNVRDSRI